MGRVSAAEGLNQILNSVIVIVVFQDGDDFIGVFAVAGALIGLDQLLDLAAVAAAHVFQGAFDIHGNPSFLKIRAVAALSAVILPLGTGGVH